MDLEVKAVSGGDRRGEDGDKGGELRGVDPKRSLLSGRSIPLLLRGMAGLVLELMLCWAADSKMLP